jgi:hypothetical protein
MADGSELSSSLPPTVLYPNPPLLHDYRGTSNSGNLKHDRDGDICEISYNIAEETKSISIFLTIVEKP